ncbi:hypothetical protein RHSIM_Rhsim05G0068100 [Rhododendron simsii]|uniref:Uncharacterized protein n=1 Tax=Rhododendron simsii TaxID=118357 RepID=A0A834GYF4_RHOSS|nr:hypothetical protein RHSIM_Rhsim05G0068100 [Rhododendron simsii]
MELCGATSFAWTNSISPSLHFSQSSSVYEVKRFRILCVSTDAVSAQSQKVMLSDNSVNWFSNCDYASRIVRICFDVDDENQMTVSITGATGFIGRRLVQRLHADNHRVRVLTRSRSNAQLIFPVREFPGIVIAEEPKWSPEVKTSIVAIEEPMNSGLMSYILQIKKEIKTSRISVTSKVVDMINDSQDEVRPTVLVSATAVGFYGTSETQVFNEQSPSGNDYLAEVCREWEATALRVNKDVRVALIRTGVVLGKDGGALAKMIPLFMMFAGGPLGSGRQWFSWIHLDDIVNLIYEALSNPSYKGVINGTAPNPVRFGEMCAQLGSVMGRPSWLPVPDLALKAVLGEGASVVLEGQKVLPARAKELGFQFQYPYVKDALRAILSQGI